MSTEGLRLVSTLERDAGLLGAEPYPGTVATPSSGPRPDLRQLHVLDGKN